MKWNADFVLVCIEYHVEISDEHQAQDCDIRGERLRDAYPAETTDRRVAIQNETARLDLEPEIIQSQPEALIGRGPACRIIVKLAIHWVLFHADLNRCIVGFIIE